MFNWIAAHAWAEIWSIAWHFGIIGFVAIASGLYWWFGPLLFKQTALHVMVGAIAFLFAAGIYTRIGAQYVQAKWNIEANAAVAKTQTARDAATRMFPLGPDVPHARVLANDPWDRDQDEPASGPKAGLRPADPLLGRGRHRTNR